MEKIEHELGYTREHLLVLGLILGNWVSILFLDLISIIFERI